MVEIIISDHCKLQEVYFFSCNGEEPSYFESAYKIISFL